MLLIAEKKAFSTTPNLSLELDAFCTNHTLTTADICKEVCDKHICDICDQMGEAILVATHLGLSKADIEAIKYRAGQDMKLMRLYILQEWKTEGLINGTATYQVLLEALLKCKSFNTAYEVCKLLKQGS